MTSNGDTIGDRLRAASISDLVRIRRGAMSTGAVDLAAMVNAEIQRRTDERYRPRPENTAGLPTDLDGDFYRTDSTIGPWKCTPCCGAFVTGTETGVVCRSCFAPMDDFHDAPARLSVDDEPSMPSWLTAIRIDLNTNQNGQNR